MTITVRRILSYREGTGFVTAATAYKQYTTVHALANYVTTTEVTYVWFKRYLSVSVRACVAGTFTHIHEKIRSNVTLRPFNNIKYVCV